MNPASIVLALKTLIAVASFLFRGLRVFWSAFAVGLAALAAAVNGDQFQALSMLAAALGLGQVLHSTARATVAAELAQLGAGAARSAADLAFKVGVDVDDAAQTIADAVASKLSGRVVFDGPPTFVSERRATIPIKPPPAA